MLSSKYAPPIALAIVFAMIIGLLGFYFAVKPQLDEVSSLSSREQDVRANVAIIESDSQSLDDASVELAAAPDISGAIDLNAPSTVDWEVLNARISAAVVAAGVEIKSITAGGVIALEPWEIPSEALPSSGVASLFESVRLPRVPGEPNSDVADESVIAPAAEESASSDTTSSLFAIDLTVVVKGHPGEVMSLLRELARAESSLFLVHDVGIEGRTALDTPDAGFGVYADGDIVATIVGTVFLLNPDYAVDDEESLGTYELPGGESPLVEPEPGDPQPGASN